MSTVLGNANMSLVITGTKLALQMDEVDVLKITHGSNVLDLGGLSL